VTTDGRKVTGTPVHPPVVAVVCSAGALPALSKIVARLPAGFPAAVLLLQHRTPHGEHELARILQRVSALPVTMARDGDPLRPGEVLVAPAGHHTLVTTQATIVLIPSGDPPPYRPSADLLLTTLALAVGPDAIAVVLSGYGNDGATGATAIHRFGGVVIASDKATSMVYAMPYASIMRDAVVDHVTPVDDIPALLGELLVRPGVPPAE
jgi:two-component system chemotaxis response regulator CheB